MDWKIYVHGTIEPGQWLLVWDNIQGEPVCAEFVEDQEEPAAYWFLTNDGYVIPLENVTHIMPIKAPDGQREHWE